MANIKVSELTAIENVNSFVKLKEGQEWKFSNKTLKLFDSNGDLVKSYQIRSILYAHTKDGKLVPQPLNFE
jgi:hypothetical protein